jgi:hypothetical protein
MLAFAGVLAIQAIWILAAELSRPSVSEVDLNAESAGLLATQRSAAGEAARIGYVRGDLSAAYALAYADLAWGVIAEAATTESTAAARAAAERALSLAPHNARVWLLLASLAAPLDLRKGIAALKMSYYTGPNDFALTPLRLLVAMRSDVLADDELSELAQWEIRTILARKPELKRAILAAYRKASPLGRQFLEKTLRELDPDLLKRM